jgi:D-glycero-D-manno-heptose 1,7-bisphosphate phosphatase
LNRAHTSALSLRTVQHVILDRDGVLNKEVDGGYISTPERFQWIPGSLDALVKFRSLGLRISVATNQSGVGRGKMSESDLLAVHQKMTSDACSAGGSIDEIFYCPHSPSEQCACRKPAPGLVNAAIDRSGISAAQTLVIGDDVRDLEAAKVAGVRSALVRTGKGARHASLAISEGIAVFDDLYAVSVALTKESAQGDA